MDWIRYILLFPIRFLIFIIAIPLYYAEWLFDVIEGSGIVVRPYRMLRITFIHNFLKTMP